MKTAAVVTVTNGKREDELAKCIAAVKAQTYPCQHYVLLDGISPDRFHAEYDYYDKNLHFCYWAKPIGGKDLEGRRWLAAAPHLINEDVTFFCNDDDWYEPNHVESIMTKIDQGSDWAYSFRKIFDKEGNYLFDDNCEALGEVHPVWVDDSHHFVDWCMWGMKTECLKRICGIFDQKGWGIDRVFYANAKAIFPKFVATGLHTFCFRLGGNEYSVKKEFFEEGNAVILKRFNGKLPWILT